MTRVLDHLDAFRTVTSASPGYTRLAYTEYEDQAHDLVWDALRDIPGLTRVNDAAGNLFVVPEVALGPNAPPVVLVGSHVDTVIEGGWLDGTLGVAVAMDVLRAVANGGPAHGGLALVVFRDEEGVRFNTGLFGSRVFAGLCNDDDLAVADRDGVTVRDVVPDPAGCLAYAPPVTPRAFLECHIEQGVRLETSGTALGVVTSMVGIRRLALASVGEANHAGTTPMTRRVDALTTASAVVAGLPRLVDDLPDTVITCGRMRVTPGAPNIVPGRVEAIVEIRARTAAEIATIETRLRDLVTAVEPAIPGGRVAALTLSDVVNVAPTAMDDGLLDLLEAAADTDGIRHERMASMAGHDAQHAALRCPAGMFFIPSINGISHNPAEDSLPEHIELAAAMMHRWAVRCLDAAVLGSPPA